MKSLPDPQEKKKIVKIGHPENKLHIEVAENLSTKKNQKKKGFQT